MHQYNQSKLSWKLITDKKFGTEETETKEFNQFSLKIFHPIASKRHIPSKPFNCVFKKASGSFSVDQILFPVIKVFFQNTA